jgi:prepilin-type N-terminal cleavage/methylation domain-containing protein
MIRAKPAFGLLELLIVIAIMALLLTIAVPQFSSFIPRYQRTQFFNRLNALVQAGILRSLKNKKFHTITFDLEKKLIILEEWSDTEKTKKPIAHESSLTKPCPIPNNIEIKQIFIEKFDEIGKYLGNKKAARVWFFISGEGKTQSVIVNAIDQKNNNNQQAISLVLNTFSGQFELYDSFQKP